MKKLLTCIFLFGTSFSLLAQDSDNKSDIQHEVGINATGFINSFLSFNERNGAIGSFLFSYRQYRPDKKTIRMGFDIDFNNIHRIPEDEDDEVTSTGLGFNYRLGWENQSKISERFTFLNGFDGLLGYSNSIVKSKNSFEDVSTNDWTMRLGGGLYGGLQFKINDRMGFFTESTLYLVYSHSIEKTKFSKSDDQKEKITSWNLNIILPTTLFFYLKF